MAIRLRVLALAVLAAGLCGSQALAQPIPTARSA